MRRKEHLRYHIEWKEEQPDGTNTRNTIVTNHLSSPGKALSWFLNIKPYVNINTIKIRAWDRNCKQ